MKKILISIPLLICINCFSQNANILDKPKVDERVELLSIVFRLAEAEEYSENRFKLYTNKIDAHFNQYKNNELIQFVKQIRQENGIGYDAVMKMAVHIGKAPEFTPLVKISDSIPNKRWGKKNTEKFIQLLGAFYKDANCEEFFKSNVDLYKAVSNNFLPIYEHLDLNWYQSFYGQAPNEKFVIVNGLANGRSNYAAAVNFEDGQREVYAIMGVSVDSLKIPSFSIDGETFEILLHEFNHSFVNKLIDKNMKEFEESGKKIFEVVGKKMARQAYTYYQPMLYEALVRACVIKYMKDHNVEQNKVEEQIISELNNGFLWIRELVEELEKYSKQRAQYPTLESYIPNIISAYKTYAGNIAAYFDSFEKERPKIVSINEFKNFDQNVDSKINTITINFDRPLKFYKNYYLNYGKKGESYYPNYGKIKISEDRKSIKIDVKLLPLKEYQFVLPGWSFTTERGVGIEDYTIEFKTQ